MSRAARNQTSAPPAPAPEIKPTGMPTQFFRTIDTWLGSGAQVLWFHTPGDEERIEAAIREFAASPGNYGDSNPDPFLINQWQLGVGCDWLSGPEKEGSAEAFTGLAALARLEGRRFVFMRDMADLLNIELNKAGRRELMELCKNQQLSNTRKQTIVVLLSSNPTPHPALQDYVTIISVPLPDRNTLRSTVVDWALGLVEQAYVDGGNQAAAAEIRNYPAEKRDRLASSLMGLSMQDARKTFSFALGTASLTDRIFDVISDEKGKLVARVEGLTFVPNRKIQEQGSLGGFEAFTQFLHERRHAYSSHANRLEIERPRGVVLLGPPGTAKTTAGHIAARILGLDLVTLDIGAMFQGVVGSSEARMRSTLATIGAMSRVCLLLDELDKSLGSAHSNQSTDSGVSARVLAYLLKWLSERSMVTDGTNQTFVIATMNRVKGMPPELLRPGRFDRIFYTSLPDNEARRQIMEIHLRRRGLDPAAYDLQTLADDSITDKFAGGDLEEAIISARMSAFNAAMEQTDEVGRALLSKESIRPTMEHLATATRQISPVARVHSEEIQSLAEFCAESGCSPVAAPRAAATTGTRRIRAGNSNN